MEKPQVKITSGRRLFKWEDLDDYSVIDNKGNVIDGVVSLTVDQYAHMFWECISEKEEKLKKIGTEKAKKTVEKIVFLKELFIKGEFTTPDEFDFTEIVERINFKRESALQHSMLILMCRNGQEWNGYKGEN